MMIGKRLSNLTCSCPRIFVVTAVLATSIGALSAAGPPTADPAIAIASFARESAGRVGVAAMIVETGQRIGLHAAERYPMQSVFKLPLAMHVFDLVEHGQLRLDDTVALGPRDLSPSFSPLAEQWPEGVTLSVGDLLRRVVEDSDNSAADTLLRLTGGPPAVTAYLRAMGIGGIRVDRSERQLAVDLLGVRAMPPDPWWTRAEFARLAAAVPPPQRRSAYLRYERDARDTATPDAAVDLLGKLARGEVLAATSRDQLLAWMTTTTRAPRRIKGLLPSSTAVAHRPGTGEAAGMGAATNDIGIVTMKDGRRLAIAVFVAASPRPLEERERTIAEIARVIYEAWTRQNQRSHGDHREHRDQY